MSQFLRPCGAAVFKGLLLFFSPELSLLQLRFLSRAGQATAFLAKTTLDIFGHGEGAKTAIAYGVPVLGEIEIDPRIRLGGDTGKPVAALGEDGAGAKSLYSVARAVANRLEEVAGSIGGPSIQID